MSRVLLLSAIHSSLVYGGHLFFFIFLFDVTNRPDGPRLQVKGEAKNTSENRARRSTICSPVFSPCDSKYRKQGWHADTLRTFPLVRNALAYERNYTANDSDPDNDTDQNHHWFPVIESLFSDSIRNRFGYRFNIVFV
jgi:hypothetical protein